MTEKKFDTKKFFYLLLFPIFYGVALSTIPNSNFHDFNNYLEYADSSNLIFLKHLSGGFTSLIFNEPIWLIFNISLSNFLTNDQTIRFIIFFSAFAASFSLINRYPKALLLLLILLLTPNFIKNYLIHLRQGFAISIFLLGYFSENKKIKFIMMSAAPLIHSSFFIILTIMITSKLMNKFKISIGMQFLFFLFLGIASVFSLSTIAGIFGFRQANEYAFTGSDASGFAFITWSLILILLFSSGKKFLKTKNFEIGIIIYYISIYWFLEFSGRVFESGLILVLASGFFLPKIQKYIFFIVIFSLNFTHWLTRINSPLWGFGIN